MEHCYLEIQHDAGTELVGLAGAPLTLGRSAANTVSFPSDDGVSPQHAVLEASASGWRVRDVGSWNGTYVNGQKLDRERILQPGDEIALGGNRLMFKVGQADEPAPRAGPSEIPGLSAGGYLDLSEEWHAATPPRSAPPTSAHPPVEDLQPATRGGDRPLASVVTSHADPDARPEFAATQTRRGRGQVRGVARDIQIRRSEDTPVVLAFRVDRYDDSGNRVDPVSVEFPSYRSGQVSEGEEVDVVGKWSRGTLRAEKVINISTHSEIQGPLRAAKIFGVLVLLFFLGWFVFLGLLAAGQGP